MTIICDNRYTINRERFAGERFAGLNFHGFLRVPRKFPVNTLLQLNNKRCWPRHHKSITAKKIHRLKPWMFSPANLSMFTVMIILHITNIYFFPTFYSHQSLLLKFLFNSRDNKFTKFYLPTSFVHWLSPKFISATISALQLHARIKNSSKMQWCSIIP